MTVGNTRYVQESIVQFHQIHRMLRELGELDEDLAGSPTAMLLASSAVVLNASIRDLGERFERQPDSADRETLLKTLSGMEEARQKHLTAIQECELLHTAFTNRIEQLDGLLKHVSAAMGIEQ